MALKNVLGQDRALNILRGCVSKDRIAHAYLFSGEDGIGKRLTAVNFAKILNCQNNRDLPTRLDSSLAFGSPRRTAKRAGQAGALSTTGDDKSNSVPRHSSRITHYEIDCCDKCPSCIKIDKEMHPDVFFIAPENGQIKVDTIRRLEESLSYKPFEGKWKIAVIDKADTLNQSAANAFLKTLEEPPGQSLLLLISSLPEMLSLTIRSRCQRIYFSPLPLKDMNRLLENQLHGEDSGIHDGKAALLGLLSGGRPGWALSQDLITRRDRTFDDFKALLDRAEENLWEDRDSMEEWFDWVHLWLRDIAVFKATGREDLMINQDRGNEIKSISQKASLKDILKLSGSFYDIKDYLRFNLNKQLTLYHTYLSLRKTFG